MLQIEPIPALNDNYIWLLSEGDQAIIVDPGESTPVLERLQARGLHLQAILLTHHHQDHCGGASALKTASGARVFGPEHAGLSVVDQPLKGGERLQLLGASFQVWATPGHTLDHIVFYSADATAHPLLLCGDTLFSAGCGRLFEGSAAQLYQAMELFRLLPGSTEIFCAHEYTLSNLAFAQAVEPNNPALTRHLEKCAQLRRAGRPTLPSSLTEELSYNPFLRYREESVRAAAEAHTCQSLPDPVDVLAALRCWKDQF